MSNWIPIHSVNELQSGDIFATPSRVPKNSPVLPNMVFPLVSHVGMIVKIDGKLYVLHNPFRGKPEIVPYEDIFDNREIEKIIRTNLTTEEILNRYQQCLCSNDTDCFNQTYQFFHFNCEDLVREICKCDIGFDQRKGWGIVVGLLVIILIVVIFKK